MNRRRSKFGRRDRGRGSSTSDVRGGRRSATELPRGDGEPTTATDHGALHAQPTSMRDRKHIKAIKAGRTQSARDSGTAFGRSEGHAPKSPGTFARRSGNTPKGAGGMFGRR